MIVYEEINPQSQVKTFAQRHFKSCAKTIIWHMKKTSSKHVRANRCCSLELLSSRRLQFASRSLFMFVLSEKYVLPASDKPSPRCFSLLLPESSFARCKYEKIPLSFSRLASGTRKRFKNISFEPQLEKRLGSVSLRW